ncbi:complex I NDUFA9 subunit family protein [Halomonas sp. I1]|uniref:complex I NDUFA9 subunit family protein n=1 Tax=Halomonas sp. I1 TaxID=393536 RepID=UPI0028DD4805|nr:complex I NDUFA9 subunit family protein [Halomonas sp. I1]MDT8895366.1 complex I NDUFA9 subunit family protein [Halomonas sp. I1]
MTTSPTVVFGGTGFLGATLVRELVESGRPTRLVARRPVWPSWAEDGDPLEVLEADIRDGHRVAEVLEGAGAVVNTTSLYVPSRRLGFEDIHVTAAAELARQARAAGIDRLVQLSGIGATLDSPSAYVRARAHGETAVLDILPKAIILRPSVLFGRNDAFLSSLAGLTRLPAIPLFGRGRSQLQPVHVVDVARAIVRLTAADRPRRYLFELGGADILSYREALTLVMQHLGRERPLVPLPFAAWHALAFGLGGLPSPPLTRDQVILMQSDNRVSEGVGTFADLGIRPRALRESLPDCLPRG